MNSQQHSYGIQGQSAPEWNIPLWIDSDGNKMDAVHLKDLNNQVKVIYGFQSWCPGCHSHGLPSLQKLVKTFDEEENIAFLAVQTVFKGQHTNTFDKLRATQLKYKLKIPFGHDPGDESTRSRSNLMYHYRTGGTPWFIIIDQHDKVVFNDYHIDVNKTIELLRRVIQE